MCLNQVEASIFVKRQSCISLNVLNDIEGVDFMKTRTGFVKDEDHANIVLLVDELGGLPLALEQAAAHIKSIKCSYSLTLSDIYSSSALSTTRSHLPVKFDNHFKVLFSVS
jgi:hypothetical protein